MKVLVFLASCLFVGMSEDVIPAVQELRTGNLLFSARTYTELAKINKQNFLFCPLSVSVVLALVEAGSGGRTAQQLRTGLNLPSTSELIQEAYKSASPSLNIEKEYTLTSANKIYLKNDFEIKPKFAQVATEIFNAESQRIDFSKAEEAVSEINGWVKQKTKNNIKDLLKSKDIDVTTRAVLVNALYFNGNWVKPFKPEKTSRRDFYSFDNKPFEVNMLKQTDHFNYYEDTNAKFLEMFYEGGDISMTFVLPNEANGFQSLEANIEKVLNAPHYNEELVHVQIPNINQESSINFIPILQNLGIVDLFEPAANLTGMAATSESLYVSKVIQKTFIDINDKGTTAAAATAVIILPGMPRPPPLPPKEFIANRPFIYFLKYRYGILFIGRYVGKN